MKTNSSLLDDSRFSLRKLIVSEDGRGFLFNEKRLFSENFFVSDDEEVSVVLC